MAKGFFSQGVCLLTNGRTCIGDIKAALKAHGFPVLKEMPPHEQWCLAGPTVVIAFSPEVNGYVVVDVVNRRWPESMGDPKSDPTTFAAWAAGRFGPFAFPNGLARATQHAGTSSIQAIADAHAGFIRIRISYVFGAHKDAPVLPDPYDPLPELTFLNRVVVALFDAPGVLCYFNPNGEVLSEPTSFRNICEQSAKQQKVPLLLWTNTRLFTLDQQFAFMDTLGNSQLDVSDIEAVFPHAAYEPGTVGYYLLNVTHYLFESHPKIRDGEAIDGPEETALSWTIEVCESGTAQPPRPVLRLYPKASRRDVRKALAALGAH